MKNTHINFTPKDIQEMSIEQLTNLNRDLLYAKDLVMETLNKKHGY